jgi:O-antigen ligase
MREQSETPPGRISLDADARWLLWGVCGVALVGSLLLSLFSPNAILFAALAVLAVIMVVLRQDERLAVVIVVISVMLDWYQLLGTPLHFPIIALVAAGGLLALLFLMQSRERPWASLPSWPLWGVLLVLAVPAILIGSSKSESAQYALSVLGNGLLMYLLGAQLARDVTRVRRLLSGLVAFGAFVALQSLIAVSTGIFLLETAHEADYLASDSNFTLAGSQSIRAGSFLQNPDWNGSFLAVMVFLAVGLLLGSASLWAKALYAGEVLLILAGLFVTYSTAAWLAVVVGGLVFMVLALRGWVVLRGRTLLLLLGVGALAVAGAGVLFHAKAAAVLQHIENPQEYSLRLGAWETALRVIQAHPLIGIGFGLDNYLARAEPYRVPLQYRPLAHPHEAYLELAALGGIPLLIVFLGLLGSALWRALRHFRLAERRARPLLGGAFAALIVLSVNSLAINGWTLTPLAALGWLILGALASPSLAQALRAQPDRDPDAQRARATGETRLPLSGSVRS